MHHKDDLGDRIKTYEAVVTSQTLDATKPIIARIDGRAFSTFTRGTDRPFDSRMMAAMIDTTKHLVDKTHARIGYTQSDEITLCWLFDAPESQPLFGAKYFKLHSILASMAASAFTMAVLKHIGQDYAERMPHFDARVFNVPNETEAANTFLWRALDCRKNAVNSACRAHYSTKDMHGADQSRMREMLNDKGIEFEDYPAAIKWGNWCRRVSFQRSFTADELAEMPEKYRLEPDALVMRSEVRLIDMPEFRTVKNREAVIFDAAEPQTV